MSVLYKYSFLELFYNHFYEYPTFMNSNYFFGFGFLGGLCLMIQVITGIFLSMHYTCNIELAFSSIEHMMSDVNNGWLMSYIHSNTASIFFICIYIHIGSGIFNKSFFNPLLWMTGIILFLFMMLISFLGYILPWGQMSYWGAMVITNLVSSMPFFGNIIVTWLWGGFSLGNPTLNSFFILHYLFSFFLIGVSGLHIVFLHTYGSKNPINTESWNCNTNFTPCFLTKDMLSLFFLFFLLIILVFFNPNFLGHSYNYIKANVLLTPLHIVPEWYFLPYYAILSAMPYKGLGVALLLSSILILLLLMMVPCSSMPGKHDIAYNHFFFCFVMMFFKLMWLGGQPVTEPYIVIAQLSTLFYFSYFIFFVPLTYYC